MLTLSNFWYADLKNTFYFKTDFLHDFLSYNVYNVLQCLQGQIQRALYEIFPCSSSYQNKIDFTDTYKDNRKGIYFPFFFLEKEFKRLSKMKEKKKNRLQKGRNDLTECWTNIQDS